MDFVDKLIRFFLQHSSKLAIVFMLYSPVIFGKIIAEPPNQLPPFLFHNTNPDFLINEISNAVNEINFQGNDQAEKKFNQLYIPVLMSNSLRAHAYYFNILSNSLLGKRDFYHAIKCLKNNFSTISDLEYFYSAHLGLSYIYTKLRIHDKAQEALDIAKISSQNNKEKKITYLIERARLEHLNQKKPEAINQLAEAIKIFQDLKKSDNGFSRPNQEYHFITSIFSICINSNNTNLLDSLTPLLKKEIEKIKILNPKSKILDLGYLCLGDYYYKKTQYQKAKTYYYQALDAPFLTLQNKYYIYHRFSEIEYAKQNYKQAIDYHVYYHNYQEQHVNDRVRNAITEQEIKYQSLEKDQQIALNQAALMSKEHEIAQQKSRYTVVLSIITLILIIIISRYIISQQKAKRIASAQALERIKALQEGEETERKRLSQELHDGINSQLAAVQSFIHYAEQETDALKQKQSFKEIKAIISQTSQEVRAIAHNLSPEHILQNGLAEGLHQFSQQLFMHSACQVDFQTFGNLSLLSEQQQLFIYRCAQELLHNILKHSHADFIIIILGIKENECTLTIEDNGKGMNNTALNQGIGMNNLCRRVKQMQGELSIESSEKHGTCIQIHLPITKTNKSKKHDSSEIYH